MTLVFLLWTFQISVDDFVVVKISHTGGHLLGPVHETLGRYLVLAVPQKVEERSVRAKFHDNAIDRSLGAHAPELDNIWMVELSEMMDARFLDILDLLDGDVLALEPTHKDRSLSAGSEPFQVGYRFKRNFPFV